MSERFFIEGDVRVRVVDPPEGCIQARIELPGDHSLVVGIMIPTSGGFQTNLRVHVLGHGDTEYREVTSENKWWLTHAQLNVLNEELPKVRDALNGKGGDTDKIARIFCDLVAPVLERVRGLLIQ